MADARVTCVTKPNHDSPHEDITHLGGPNWKWTRSAVIASIDTGSNTFHVIDAAGDRSEIGVVDPGGRRPRFVRAHANGELNNHLLALPECPMKRFSWSSD
jgi:hypothetical protein